MFTEKANTYSENLFAFLLDKRMFPIYNAYINK